MRYHARIGSALAAMALIGPAATQAQDCKAMPGTLPDVQTTIDDTQKIRFQKWSDYCFGDGKVQWQEWKYQGDWSQGVSRLALRFDFYRPAATNQTPPNGKLAIWAHPVGQNENITSNSKTYNFMLAPLLRAGYSVMSVETRHPADSFVSTESIDKAIEHDVEHPAQPSGVVRSDDIATAVRWAKFNSGTLLFDGANVILVGQSRGSLALLNGLLDLAAEPTSDWRSRDSRVKGVYVHQAQTSFKESEVATTFIKADDQANGLLYRSWFTEDFPELENVDPLSALQLAGTAPVIPVHMGYEQKLVLKADGQTVKLQCYESNNANRAWLGWPVDLPRCPVVNGNKESFDIHDPNYSQAFANVYRPRAPNKFSRCLDLGKDNLARAYGDLVAFADAATAGQSFTFTPTCVAAPPPAGAARR